VALISATEARYALPGITDEATLLTVLIDAVGHAFARKCGYPPATVGAAPTMESTSYTLDHDSIGGRDLLLRVTPATAITSVYDDAGLDFTDSTYLVPSTDYAIVEGRLLRLKSTATWGTWGVGSGRIRVAYTAGYVTVPADLKNLARMAVKYLFELRRTQGKASESSEGGGSVSYQDTARGMGDRFDLPDYIMAGLGPYVLPGPMS